MTTDPSQCIDCVRKADVFDIPRGSARYGIAASISDERPDIARRAQQIHGRCYVEYGYFDEAGLEKDGRLVPELDGSRDSSDGRIVANYLIARRRDESAAEAGATIRILDVAPGGTHEDLPTFRYFSEHLTGDVRERLAGFSGRHGVGSIREIAALANSDSAHRSGSYELMRAITQNSLIQAQKYGRRELYLASLTEISLRPVLLFAGPTAVEILGDPVQIYSNDLRSNAILVTPVLIDLCEIIYGAVEAVAVAPHSSDELDAALKKLRFLLDGLAGMQVADRVTRLGGRYMARYGPDSDGEMPPTPRCVEHSDLRGGALLAEVH